MWKGSRRHVAGGAAAAAAEAGAARACCHHLATGCHGTTAGSCAEPRLEHTPGQCGWAPGDWRRARRRRVAPGRACARAACCHAGLLCRPTARVGPLPGAPCRLAGAEQQGRRVVRGGGRCGAPSGACESSSGSAEAIGRPCKAIGGVRRKGAVRDASSRPVTGEAPKGCFAMNPSPTIAAAPLPARAQPPAGPQARPATAAARGGSRRHDGLARRA